jgi:hypothetical protein
MKKIEHFKSMVKAGNKQATATDVVNDLQDPNSEPNIPKDDVPAQAQSNLIKGKEGMKANTWFHYDHPEHGKIEVSAHHDGKQAHILGVGAPGDTHVHPKNDAGMSDEHLGAMSAHAAKLGPGQHMKKSEHQPHPGPSKSEHQKLYDAKTQSESEAKLKTPEGDAERKRQNSERLKKSEWTAHEIVFQALKNVQAKQGLAKAEEMKRDEGKAEDTGAIYNEEQEVGNQNDIQEAAKREHAQANGKKLKEFMEKAKNKSEKAAKSPIEGK